MTEPAPAAQEPCPILVLASGQRCGSTLVQRLLTSHPDILIWGEHGGHLREIMRASRTLRLWDEGLSAPARSAFEQSGHQGWIANLLPDPATVLDAARAYVRTLFAAPAAAQGRARWGFKEVRFGLEEAGAVRELFADTRVIHITRDPRDVLSSLDWWENVNAEWTREFTERAIADWLRVNESFLDGDRARSWVESWRYEDIAVDPDGFIAAASRLLEISPGDLDRSVFDRRVHGGGPQQRRLRSFAELSADLQRMLDDDRLRAVAAAYGYQLDGD
jgi:hypothetical protein